MSDNKSDEQLMMEYQMGDEDAFAVLYERHSRRVFGFLKVKTMSEALARDIFQATFLKLHVNRALYKSEFPFLPWLFTLCRNELIDTVRKRNRSREDLVGHLPETLREQVEDDSVDVNGLMSALPEQQRQALGLRINEEMPFDKIATQLSTTPANARKLVSRGIKKLRELYGKK